MHPIKSFGVEYDLEMANRSSQNLDRLIELGADLASSEVVHGDFMDDETYSKRGVKFQEFDVVFNYINNQRDIAMKVCNESPPGTAFWLLGAFPVPGFQGLVLERNLELIQEDPEIPAIHVNDVAGDVLPMYGPDDLLMQLYRKI